MTQFNTIKLEKLKKRSRFFEKMQIFVLIARQK